ncbi:MAG: cupin domain-containing protein [bacterium]|nr:cupin domain-containing protein [bacterium]
MQKVSLRETFASFDEAWVPKIAGELNGQFVKVAKFDGEYVWHSHAAEDEMFLVVNGNVEIHLRDRVIALGPGEFTIVPRGVEHKPVAVGGIADVVMFEPQSTRNTGATDHDRTIEPKDLERL